MFHFIQSVCLINRYAKHHVYVTGAGFSCLLQYASKDTIGIADKLW